MLRKKLAGWASFGVELGFGQGKLKRIEIFSYFRNLLWIAISFEFKKGLNSERLLLME
jgi:hypothetical protein